MSANETEYTPTMSDLRKWWAEDQNQTWGQDEDSHAAEFDRALAAHDAEVARNAAANALREFAEDLDHLRIRRWIRNEADRIERATASETEDASPKIEREAHND